MEMVLRSPAMLEMSNELFGGDIGEVNETALKKARKISPSSKKRWPSSKNSNASFERTRPTSKKWTEDSEKSLEEAKNRSDYKIPFDGELRLELNYVEGQSDYSVITRDVVGTLNNYDGNPRLPHRRQRQMGQPQTPDPLPQTSGPGQHRDGLRRRPRRARRADPARRTQIRFRSAS